MFSQEYKIVEQSLLKIGIELTNEYDGFIVKELKASNTLDLGSYIDIAVDTAISSVYSSGDGSGGGFSSGGGGVRRRRWRRRTLNLS